MAEKERQTDRQKRERWGEQPADLELGSSCHQNAAFLEQSGESFCSREQAGVSVTGSRNPTHSAQGCSGVTVCY